ncbi:ABC transporter transmembrane domain-containing protein [Pseudochelatococcus lubricantis]|uniref:ABC transporter transmembrane domain-containing protein n=1 Tax=Pseudochelatococcus lubricantis TaxID=1538102 RepID=UPI0036333577
MLLDRSLFRYIWRYSKRDQIAIFIVVIASLPFYFLSLDLPKQIVNDAIVGQAFRDGVTHTTFLDLGFDLPAFLGGGTVTLFPGISVNQIGLLLGLSFLFLAFVCINGAFKYWINIAKGALGERMLRRLRFDLFSTVVRFTPDTLRAVRPSETATIIKDEVEPIGGFIGDAFVQPLLLASQAATAMTFIMMQSVQLGLVVLFIVGIQFTVIPRLRRIQLRLGKERQLASRLLAGRIGEVVEGMDAVHAHGTGRWEKAEIGERLYRLFDLRFRIFKWKFMVKFLNNFLSQLTPFFFYSVGGYFALTGRLDIGQLVAVIAAYRDLPPPLKELIDWDQQRLDVQIKYDQIIQQFVPEHLLPEEPGISAGINTTRLAGPVSIEKLRVLDSNGATLVDDISVSWEYPASVALVGNPSPAPHAIADVLARRIIPAAGTVTIAGQDFLRLPEEVTGRRIACAGAQPRLFPGSLRHNLLYGLQHKVTPADSRLPDTADAAEYIRIREALRTGNPLDSPDDDWLDHATIGMLSDKEIDDMLLENLALVGMGDDVFNFGINGWVDTARYPALADKIVEARNHLRARLAQCDMSELIETFDESRYANLASIGENLLFGASRDPLFNGRGRARNPLLLRVLDAEGLTGDLVGIGARIASTMMEIFADLPPDHPLVTQFSFLASNEMDDYERALSRWSQQGLRGLGPDDRERLLAPSFDYIEPRHRLSLLDDALRARILKARRHVRDEIARTDGQWNLEPYDPDKLCHNAMLRDNLLFGRVDLRIANARARVTKVVVDVVNDLELRPAISAVGLDFEVGPGGRMLTARQRGGADLVRCIVKKPDILVIDGALSAFSDTDADAILECLHTLFSDRCLVMIGRDETGLSGFDTVITFNDEGSFSQREDAAGAPPRRQSALT